MSYSDNRYSTRNAEEFANANSIISGPQPELYVFDVLYAVKHIVNPDLYSSATLKARRKKWVRCKIRSWQ